ncbi:MAG: hypothetical protein JW793_13110 [Acidobacteria bacterium]|nr:hypothetical protein [Acidobacteriota bacterium]
MLKSNLHFSFRENTIVAYGKKNAGLMYSPSIEPVPHIPTGDYTQAFVEFAAWILQYGENKTG